MRAREEEEERRRRSCLAKVSRCLGSVSGLFQSQEETPVEGYYLPSQNTKGRFASIEAWGEDQPKREKEMKMGAIQYAWLENPSLVPKERRRYATSEQQGSFSHHSDFGKKMVTLRRFSVIGDLKAHTDRPRAATVTCKEDCLFLVFPKEEMKAAKQDFESARLAARKVFFTRLPPFKKSVDAEDYEVDSDASTLSGHNGPALKADPVEMFRENTFTKGDEILCHDVVAEKMIVIIKTGIVHFKRPCMPVPRRTESWGTTPDHQSKKNREWHKLQAGDMFCSLGALGIPHAPEPFSVEVTSNACNVYMLTGNECDMLPPHIHKRIREHLQQSMRHLLNLSAKFVSLGVQMSKKEPESAWRIRVNTLGPGPLRDTSELEDI